MGVAQVLERSRHLVRSRSHAHYTIDRRCYNIVGVVLGRLEHVQHNVCKCFWVFLVVVDECPKFTMQGKLGFLVYMPLLCFLPLWVQEVR